MKKFIITSCLFLGFSLITTIVVFFLLHRTEIVSEVQVDEEVERISEEIVNNLATTTITVPEEFQNILTESALDGSQIELTKEKISCAISKIGKVRVESISQGEMPTKAELVKLLPCATQN